MLDVAGLDAGDGAHLPRDLGAEQGALGLVGLAVIDQRRELHRRRLGDADGALDVVGAGIAIVAIAEQATRGGKGGCGQDQLDQRAAEVGAHGAEALHGVCPR